MTADFLPSPRGGVHVATWAPRGRADQSVLLVPPFAEEMNKCRQMMALAARRIAGRGLRALLPDFFGTGDSPGEFREARLDDWRDDLRLVAAHAAAEGAPVTGLVGVRFGALLALELARELPAARRIALWQPVASGQLQLTQFLRLRVAGALLEAGGTGNQVPESVQTLTKMLNEGAACEVGGYELGSGLAADLAGPDIRRLTPPAGMNVRWLEVTAGPSPEPTRAATERIREWTATGCIAEALAVQGDTFWNTVELTRCEALAEMTATFLAPAS